MIYYHWLGEDAEIVQAQQELRRKTVGAPISLIQATVATHYRIAPNEMKSARRSREVARPRQVAMYLSKQLTRQSLPDIGRRFGNRDHTTVLYAIRHIEALRRSDATIAADVSLLLDRLAA